MRGGNERRKHRRLPVRVGIFCRKVGSLHDHIFSGSTVDISPDGLLVESSQNAIMDTGDLFNVELDIPDADSADRFGGKVSAYARVVRIVDLQPEQTSASSVEPKASKKHIAFQFCTRPQFDI
jgi:hypothetical protein